MGIVEKNWLMPLQVCQRLNKENTQTVNEKEAKCIERFFTHTSPHLLTYPPQHSLSLCLSLSVCICLSVCLSLSLSLSIPYPLSLSLSLSHFWTLNELIFYVFLSLISLLCVQRHKWCKKWFLTFIRQAWFKLGHFDTNPFYFLSRQRSALKLLDFGLACRRIDCEHLRCLITYGKLRCCESHKACAAGQTASSR